MRELVFLLMVRRRCSGVVLGQRLVQQFGERVALGGADRDETPREKLAVVGRARGRSSSSRPGLPMKRKPPIRSPGPQKAARTRSLYARQPVSQPAT